MISTIAIIVASVTACGTIMKEVNICLNGNGNQNQSNVQQVINHTAPESPLERFIERELDQRDSDTEIDIKINVSHTIPRDERE